MTELEINKMIKECQERKKHYEKMYEWAEDYRLAIRRSIAVENLNIADYKKKLKGLRGE